MIVPNHRVDRVLSFLSSRPNWDPPTPSHAGESVSPPVVPGGRTHSIAGEGMHGWVPIPTRGQTLWFSRYIIQYMYFVIVSFFLYSSVFSFDVCKFCLLLFLMLHLFSLWFCSIKWSCSFIFCTVLKGDLLDFLCILFNTALSAAPQIQLCRRMLGLDQGYCDCGIVSQTLG
jgi:hypothetical protein